MEIIAWLLPHNDFCDLFVFVYCSSFVCARWSVNVWMTNRQEWKMSFLALDSCTWQVSEHVFDRFDVLPDHCSLDLLFCVVVAQQESLAFCPRDPGHVFRLASGPISIEISFCWDPKPGLADLFDCFLRARHSGKLIETRPLHNKGKITITEGCLSLDN